MPETVAAAGSGLTRRRFLRSGAAMGAGAIAGFPMVAQAQQPVRLRLQGAWSASDIYHEYALDLAKKINDMSGGRLRVEVLPAGAVVKPAELLDAVHRGVIDGCHATPAHWHAINGAFSLFGAGPALGMDGNGLLAWMHYGGGMDLYTELIHRQLNLKIVPFFTGPMPTQPLGWFHKAVQSPADFKGLKFHPTGLAAELFREMGAKPVNGGEADAVAALRQRQIDMVTAGNASFARGSGLSEAAKVCMLQSQHQAAGIFELLINRGKFDALPADLQAVVRHATAAASADMSWKALDRYSADQAWLRERQGVRFRRTPQSVLQAQLQAWRTVIARNIRDNPYFEKVWKAQMAWARRTVGWSQQALVDPAMAHEFWFGGTRRKPKT